jgi:hypothetical protein
MVLSRFERISQLQRGEHLLRAKLLPSLEGYSPITVYLSSSKGVFLKVRRIITTWWTLHPKYWSTTVATAACVDMDPTQKI